MQNGTTENWSTLFREPFTKAFNRLNGMGATLRNSLTKMNGIIPTDNQKVKFSLLYNLLIPFLD
jgi:hypothetical protein